MTTKQLSCIVSTMLLKKYPTFCHVMFMDGWNQTLLYQTDLNYHKDVEVISLLCCVDARPTTRPSLTRLQSPGDHHLRRLDSFFFFFLNRGFCVNAVSRLSHGAMWVIVNHLQALRDVQRPGKCSSFHLNWCFSVTLLQIC